MTAFSNIDSATYGALPPIKRGKQLTEDGQLTEAGLEKIVELTRAEVDRIRAERIRLNAAALRADEKLRDALKELAAFRERHSKP